VSLLDQPPLDLAAARAHLAELRSLARRRAAVGLILALLGGVLVLLGAERVGIPLLIGACAAALLVALAREDRRRLLIRLVSQDDAWAIAEVRDAADRLVSASGRRRLARGLRHAEFSVVDPFRATAVDERLRALASAIEDAAVPLEPSGAALCRRLLGEGRLSPLYNPNIADSELDRVIARIERAVDLVAPATPA
jgi:hypothetical protein